MHTALLTAARSQVTGTLTEAATVERPTHVGTATGGKGTTWQVVATTTGRAAALTGREAADAARVNPAAVTVVTLPWGTDVRTTDRVTVGGTTYQVVEVRTATNALAARCWCAAVV